MKHSYLLLLMLLLSSLFLQAQDTIVLEGQVLNDTIDKSNLTIVNRTLKRGTTTANNGSFRIEVQLNDTINISAVQYESRQFVVNETIFIRGRITLYLIPRVTELDQVTLSNVDLTGDMKKDVQNTPYKPTITARELGIPENTAPERTVEERRYYTAISSGGGVPLDGLINSITGRLKMLKKHIEVSRFQKLVEESRYTFSDSIYMKELAISKEYIADFVYYVFEDPKAKSLVDNDDVLGLLEFMKEKAITYKAINKRE
ncbi:hypothetical protein [Dokdonia sp. Hel_I_53]|uniref:hypothetical protein n=1 Tax=Dokdonia sp. Hel_I_53 TaxID=1566287 RepID=UPI00119C8E1C|nr:hypothetical protein [Dokdonia sp. Hel_I_53]TVZ53174.1 hypothetical protein OD90_2372 [Dokdonia sp. Hel_I_53]